jgi:ATP-binding cassette subfamily B protein
VQWGALAAPPDEDGTEQVFMRGAVLLTVDGVATEPPDPDTLPKELAAALREPAPRPAHRLLETARRAGPVRWRLLVAGMVVAGFGGVAEALLLRNAIGSSGVVRALVPVLAVSATVAAMQLSLALATLAVGRRLDVGLRQALLEKLPRLPDRYLRSRPSSDMAERSHAAHEVRQLPLVAGQLVAAVAEVTLTTVALWVLEPVIAPLAVASAAVILATSFLVQFPLREYEMRTRSHAGALAQITLDVLVGLAAIRAHGAETTMRGFQAERVDRWQEAAAAGSRARAVATLTQALIGIGLAVPIVLVGLPRVSGVGTGFLLVFWALAIPQSAERVALLALQYPRHRSLALRLLEPLDSEEDEGAGTGAGPRESGAGVSVVLDGVGLVNAGSVVLEHVSVSIGPGEHVAMVGSSGAGKSSICSLLLGFATPTEGSVLVDGEPLDRPRLERLRAATAWLDPGVRLWNRTLGENVGFGADADADPVDTLLELAELGEVVTRVGKGDERLGDNGGLLSGGEGQRVRFARALGRTRPRLAILDEPFRGLDHTQRRRLLARARERWREATMVCVTHDVVDTMGFDRVLVVAGGRIVEDASPAELMAREGSRYAAMVAAERELRSEFAAGRGWRGLRIEAGVLVETPADALGAPEAAAPGEGTGDALAELPPLDFLSRRSAPSVHIPGRSRIAALIAADVAVQAARYALLLLSWVVVGRRIASGDTSIGGLLPWVAVLLASVPLAGLGALLEGAIGVGIGSRLRRRLLDGGLALPQDGIRFEGAGSLLGRVMESEAVTAAVVTGGLAIAVALIEAAAAVVVLLVTPIGRPTAGALAVLVASSGLLAWLYTRRRRRWTQARIGLTEALLETIAGQRTRLVQTPANPRDDGDQAALAAYSRASVGADRTQGFLGELLPRGFLVIGVGGLLATSLVAAPGTGELAAALGAVLLASGALRRAGMGLSGLAGAALSLAQMRPVLDAASAAARRANGEERAGAGADGAGPAALHATGLRIERGRRVLLDSTDVVIRAGDRVILEGPSGAGKSTLAAVLCGLREPQAGRLALEGDGAIPGGERWRSQVVGVPQYHDNHVLMAPVVFNLLMGRAWPPAREDVAEAVALCKEIGLWPVISSMPSGIAQPLGETGWQLSQGERSLLYIVRALLGRPRILVLDESLGPLDPITARRALRTVLRHARTVVVISQQ